MLRLFSFLICYVLISTGSSIEGTKTMQPVPAPAQSMPNEGTASSPQPKTEDLTLIKDTIFNHWKEIEERYSLKLMAIGVGKDHIMMQVRRSGQIEQPVPEADIAALKKTLFELAGTEFPVKISVWECCTREADLTGKIKLFDKEQKRILIVNEQKKIGDSDLPESTWVSLEADGILIVSGSKLDTGFDLSMVGREVKAWTSGLMLQSYPGQTSALKVVIE